MLQQNWTAQASVTIWDNIIMFTGNIYIYIYIYIYACK
jgi:hypothetical protein